PCADTHQDHLEFQAARSEPNQNEPCGLAPRVIFQDFPLYHQFSRLMRLRGRHVAKRVALVPLERRHNRSRHIFRRRRGQFAPNAVGEGENGDALERWWLLRSLLRHMQLRRRARLDEQYEPQQYYDSTYGTHSFLLVLSGYMDWLTPQPTARSCC